MGIFCVVSDEGQAETIVDRLRIAGFAPDEISVVLPDRADTRRFAKKAGTHPPEAHTTGAGAIFGATLGWIAGIGALTIPGVGPFIAAGPVMAALTGTVGGIVGGIAGALVGLGFSHDESKFYEEHIRRGKILIAVHANNEEQARLARTLFEHADAHDIRSTDGTATLSTEPLRNDPGTQPVNPD